MSNRSNAPRPSGRSLAGPATLNDLPPWQANAVAYLARYDGQTFAVYRRYLNQWITWCTDQQLDPLEDIQRGHVELYIREVSEHHKPSTVCTMLNPVRGYYEYAVLDGLIDRDPAHYARLPKVHYTKKPNRDVSELKAFRRAAEATSPRHAALAHLTLLMGMRVSEACSITVEQALNVEQGMRVLRYIGKGSKPAATAVPYQSLGSLDAAIAGRTTGPLLTTVDGRPLSRHAAHGLMRTTSKRAGLSYVMNPHYARALGGSQLDDLTKMQEFWRHEDPRTTQKHYNLNQSNPASQPVHLVGAKLAG